MSTIKKCHLKGVCLLKLSFILLVYPLTGPLKAQPTSNFFINITSQPVSLSYTSAADYENPKLVDKAFQFNLAAKNSLYDIYVRMERFGGAGPSQLPLNLFYVQFDSSSPAKNVPLTPFYLTSIDQLLYSDSLRGNQTDTYRFDFGHLALEYAYLPGQYILLVTFTLTTP